MVQQQRFCCQRKPHGAGHSNSPGNGKDYRPDNQQQKGSLRCYGAIFRKSIVVGRLCTFWRQQSIGRYCGLSGKTINFRKFFIDRRFFRK